MFQEEIADYTADHIREHIRDYLDFIGSLHTDNLVLAFPQQIEVSSQVGGLVSEMGSTTPAYAVDCVDKRASPSRDDLWVYEYDGAISGIIAAQSEGDAERLCQRHAGAVELFIREHRILHAHSTDYFQIIELAYVNTAFSGAMEVTDGTATYWIAAFTHNVLWFTSESGPDQHA